MCECGCISGNQVFKLKAPKGWYVIELLPGCDYCSHGPGIKISYPEANKDMDDLRHFAVLPALGDGENCVTMIKCGLDLEEAKEAGTRCFVCPEGVLEDNRIDEVLANILGEDFWKEALTKPPSVIYPEE